MLVALAGSMKKLKGQVISILTTWIWNGGPYTVPSAMSKAGINIMTKSLAAGGENMVLD